MLYLANKVIVLGSCRPHLAKARRCFVTCKNSDLRAVRFRDWWERRTCGENVTNKGGPLNLNTRAWVAGCWVQFSSVTALALAYYDHSCLSLWECVPWVLFIFIKVWGKNWIQSFADCTENVIPPPKKGGGRAQNKLKPEIIFLFELFTYWFYVVLLYLKLL